MTVASSTDRATLLGNGTTTVFPLPFRFFANSEIQAWLVTNATGALTALTLGTHYTLVGAGLPEVNGNAASVLTMVTAPTSLQSLFVQRVIPATQATDIVNQGRFFPEIHEDVFDRLTMLIQQNSAGIKGAIRVPDTDPEPARLPTVTARADKLMSFDASGNPTAIAAAAQSATDLELRLNNATDPAKGAAIIGYKHTGSGAVARTLRNKALESVSVGDFGATTGNPDNSTQIANAKLAASASGGSIHYGGKFPAAGFWENLSPTVEEWIRGSVTDHKTDTVSSKPVTWTKHFVGKTQSVTAYDHFAAAFDAYTLTGVDVQSGATAVFRMNSLSNNSLGTDFNKTNQVAIVANASAQSTTSSASVEAVNAIAQSLYTGALPQMVIGMEVDLSNANPPGFFGGASTAYSVGVSVNYIGSVNDGTVAFASDTSDSVKTWRHGAILGGSTLTGMTIARNGTRRPETGIWVSAADTFGIYVGAKAKHTLNPGAVAEFTSKPVIGIALGQEGATAAPSHKLRFTNTSGASAEINADVYTNNLGSIIFEFAGTPRASMDVVGALTIGGTAYVSGTDNVTIGSTVGGRQFSVATTASAQQIGFVNGNGLVGSISTSGTATSYNTASDYRLKTDVKPMSGALERISLLKPSEYKWVIDGSVGEGFLAHELQSVIPSAVTGGKDSVDADGKPIYQAVDLSFIIPTLVQAIKEQQVMIDLLNAKLAALTV